jgi:hypothetical protein
LSTSQAKLTNYPALAWNGAHDLKKGIGTLHDVYIETDSIILSDSIDSSNQNWRCVLASIRTPTTHCSRCCPR